MVSYATIAIDSHEMVALTEDFFYMFPDGDRYEYVNVRFAALTSRGLRQVTGGWY